MALDFIESDRDQQITKQESELDGIPVNKVEQQTKKRKIEKTKQIKI
jgi:hypothetical protein